MGLDITIKVTSALDGSTVFDAYLRQRGTCLFDTLPMEVWDDLTKTEYQSGVVTYELPKEKFKRVQMYENLKTGYNEYTRLAWMLSTLILIFPHDYSIKFEG